MNSFMRAGIGYLEALNQDRHDLARKYVEEGRECLRREIEKHGETDEIREQWETLDKAEAEIDRREAERP